MIRPLFLRSPVALVLLPPHGAAAGDDPAARRVAVLDLNLALVTP
jgi:hypothetical protein